MSLKTVLSEKRDVCVTDDGRINKHRNSEDTEKQWTHETHFKRPFPKESTQEKVTSAV